MRSIWCKRLDKRGNIRIGGIKQTLDCLKLRRLYKRLITLYVHNDIGLYSTLAECLETTVRSALVISSCHYWSKTSVLYRIEYTFVISCHEDVVKHFACLLADADNHRFAA